MSLAKGALLLLKVGKRVVPIPLGERIVGLLVSVRANPLLGGGNIAGGDAYPVRCFTHRRVKPAFLLADIALLQRATRGVPHLFK
ncbi:MAG: hypothetical protein F4Z50_01460 [Gemmatimonadetes bacterium]|nr:hypothetical protein [Gemmatimonadota bacterium]MYI38705.1 hypothetical protein [Acidobacteriota bacterium]